MGHLNDSIRILHLEDNHGDAVLIADLLDAGGVHCAIHPAVNRAQFEAALDEAKFDLILCDFNLPDFDGFSALQLAKRKHPETPLIIVSGVIDSEEAVHCLQAGATDYVLKQRFERLPSAVRRALEEGEQQRQRKRAEETVRKLNADLERRVEERTVELQTTLNELHEAKTLLLRNEKVASLGRLCAGLIHEINNPLNYVSQGLFIMERIAGDLPDGSRGEFVETLDDVRDGVTRVVRMVSGLRRFTEVTSDPSQVFELKPLVEKMLLFFAHEISGDVRIQVDVAETIALRGDSNQIVQVLINLIQNALDAIRAKNFEADGFPVISVSATFAEQRVILKIRDNGIGIPPEIIGSIFDPFFTTKDVGGGVGLGLTITHRIVAESGGEIDVQSEPGDFCEFILRFPLAFTV